MAEHYSGKTSSSTLGRNPSENKEGLRKEAFKAEAEIEMPHDRKKEKNNRKSKGFPIVGLVFMFVLIGFIMGAVYFGMQYMNKYDKIRGEYEVAAHTAEAERDAAKALYAEANPNSETNTAERRQVTEEMMAEANAKLDSLRKKSEETETAIREAEEKIEKLRDTEGYDYFHAIYDEYIEGRAYVEELLSGD